MYNLIVKESSTLESRNPVTLMVSWKNASPALKHFLTTVLAESRPEKGGYEKIERSLEPVWKGIGGPGCGFLALRVPGGARERMTALQDIEKGEELPNSYVLTMPASDLAQQFAKAVKQSVDGDTWRFSHKRLMLLDQTPALAEGKQAEMLFEFNKDTGETTIITLKLVDIK